MQQWFWWKRTDIVVSCRCLSVQANGRASRRWQPFGKTESTGYDALHFIVHMYYIYIYLFIQFQFYTYDTNTYLIYIHKSFKSVADNCQNAACWSTEIFLRCQEHRETKPEQVADLLLDSKEAGPDGEGWWENWWTDGELMMIYGEFKVIYGECMVSYCELWCFTAISADRCHFHMFNIALLSIVNTLIKKDGIFKIFVLGVLHYYPYSNHLFHQGGFSEVVTQL